MKLPTDRERQHFAVYVRSLTDAQLKQVYVEKVDERQTIFAAILENEIARRASVAAG